MVVCDISSFRESRPFYFSECKSCDETTNTSYLSQSGCRGDCGHAGFFPSSLRHALRRPLIILTSVTILFLARDMHSARLGEWWGTLARPGPCMWLNLQSGICVGKRHVYLSHVRCNRFTTGKRGSVRKKSKVLWKERESTDASEAHESIFNLVLVPLRV